MTATTDTLRFATFLAPELFGMYEAIARHVGEALRMPWSLVVGEHRYDIFEAGEAEFGFI